MIEQLTTFRDEREDGVQQHESTAAEEVISLDEQVIHQIGLLGESYQEDETSPHISIGMGLWIYGAKALDKLPQLNSIDRKQPNANLFPLLDAFGKFLHTNKGDVFHGLKPSYVRVIAIGSSSRKLVTWHCDTVIDRISPGNFINRTPLHVGRIVVNVDSLLRNDRCVNVRFVNGSFSVSSIVPETDQAKKWEDLSIGYPAGSTVVTRESGSIINIGDLEFEPPENTVQSFNSLTLTNLGCTTLHAAVSSPDSVRLSLQCFYDGVEK